MVVDTHRLLIPDLHWIERMCHRRAIEGLPRVWAVRVPADLETGSSAGELVVDGKPLARHERFGENLEAAVLKMCVEAGALSDGDSLTSVSRHIGAGCVLLQSQLLDRHRLVAVASCPRWYFGSMCLLTCMMPPEAARVARWLDLPKVSPDCVFMQGNDPDGSMKDDLRRTTGELQSPGRLQEAG